MSLVVYEERARRRRDGVKDLLLDEINRQKWPLDMSSAANKVRIFPKVSLCAYFNFK